MSANGFVHEALFYEDADRFLSGTVPFVEEGLAAGEPVLVAVPEANLDLLRAGLSTTADHVRFADMTQAGRNPGRIIPWVLYAFLAEHPNERVRIIGEPIWAGRSPVEYPACVQHEALINVAFDGSGATILCPYDARRLPPDVLIDAEATHPVLVSGDTRKASDGYQDPHAVVAAFNAPLPGPPAPAATLVFSGDQLRSVRSFAIEHARYAGLAKDRLIDLEMAVNEVATNAVAHSPGPGTIRAWSERDAFVCEISDPGSFTNPLAGRIPPPAGSGRGRGLLLVNHVCDLVRLYTSGLGTTIRLHLNR